MELTNTFTIPVPVDEAWKVLNDIERIAPCMPGAALQEAAGDTYRGTVKVKVGPIAVTYKGTAEITERDDDAHRAVINASGKETRGSGTARATVTTTLNGKGDQTEVAVVADLAITGKPAQFGRGVMADVAGKLVGQFADCLAEELAAEEVPEAGAAAPEPQLATTVPTDQPTVAAEAPPQPATAGAAGADLGVLRPRRQPAEAIDLLDVAGVPVAKRLGPVVAAAAAVLLLVWLVRRRR